VHTRAAAIEALDRRPKLFGPPVRIPEFASCERETGSHPGLRRGMLSLQLALAVHDGLGVEERLHAEIGQFPAIARGLDAAEGQARVG
jgi:hypothetical protein